MPSAHSQRTAQCPQPARADSLLSAPAYGRWRRYHRRRGAHSLAACRSLAGLAGRVYSHRRGDGPDCRYRQLGAARGLCPIRAVGGERHPHSADLGQRQCQAVPCHRLCRADPRCAGANRHGSGLPQSGDHRIRGAGPCRGHHQQDDRAQGARHQLCHRRFWRRLLLPELPQAAACR